MKLTIYFFIIFLSVGNLFAQSDTSVFVVPEMKIYQMEKGKEEIYKFEQHKNFLHLNGDSIIVSPKRYKYAVDISAVNKFSLRNGSKAWKMAGYAALGAFATGFIIGSLSKISVSGDGPGGRSPLFGLAFGVILAVPIGFIGGIMGALTPDYTDIILKDVRKEDRKFILLKALKEHNFE